MKRFYLIKLNKTQIITKKVQLTDYIIIVIHQYKFIE